MNKIESEIINILVDKVRDVILNAKDVILEYTEIEGEKIGNEMDDVFEEKIKYLIRDIFMYK